MAGFLDPWRAEEFTLRLDLIHKRAASTHYSRAAAEGTRPHLTH